ncbi:PEP-CTERM sorting domain-containing protein [Lacipirellula sp.]|uniref:PEP-CTERM sorting domain-containing protein n=1 Tax=Lacipirellula sp. TaxID=2691419 RepID=UPI003D09F43C
MAIRPDNDLERVSVELHLLAVTNDDRPSELLSDRITSATIDLLKTGDSFGGDFTWAGIDVAMPVSVGDKFAIAVGNRQNAAQPVQLACYFDHVYDGGDAFYLSGFGYEKWGGWDTVQGYAFRTYVADIPEPSTLALVGGVPLALAALRRRS